MGIGMISYLAQYVVSSRRCITDRLLDDRLGSSQVELVVALPMKAEWTMYRCGQRGRPVERERGSAKMISRKQGCTPCSSPTDLVAM